MSLAGSRVREEQDSGAAGGGTNQMDASDRVAIVEEPFSLAEHDRVHHQPILIDKVFGNHRPNEFATSDQVDIFGELILESGPPRG